jgi:hypothetical protein
VEVPAFILDSLVFNRNKGADLDPDPDLGPSISKQISKKNLDSYCIVTSFGLFSLQNGINVPSKSNKKKNFFF